MPSEDVAGGRNGIAPDVALNAWWHGPLGAALRETEQACLQESLPERYYPVSVQIGCPGFSLLDRTEAGLKVYVTSDGVRGEGKTCIVNASNSLPFPARSLDLVLLVHALEYSGSPHAMLREVSSAIAPEGYVVIFGFNPVSFWGIRKLIPGSRRYPPWTGRFYSPGRVQDWISLLGFELRSATMTAYELPVTSERARRHTRWLRNAGNRWWPMFGGSYMLVACKREFNARLAGAGARRRIPVRLVHPARAPSVRVAARRRATYRRNTADL